MRLSLSLLFALALPLAAVTTSHAQDAADPTVYMVSYIDVTPASRAADAGLLRQLHTLGRCGDRNAGTACA